MKCPVRKGFFVLRDCQQVATNQCMVCQRRVCQEHIVFEQGQVMCTECLAKKEPLQMASNNNPLEIQGDMQRQGWQHRYRRSYYSRNHYSPFYTGVFYNDYYDDYDYRSVDPAAAENVNFDDNSNEDVDFFDS